MGDFIIPWWWDHERKPKMAVWRGGFSTKRMNIEDFIKYVHSFPRQKWVQFLVLHNSGAPDMHQARNERHYSSMADAFNARQASFEEFYKRKWAAGPHGFIYEDGLIGQGTPLNRNGTHSPSWNRKSWGFEMVADFRTGKDDPTKDGGLVIYDTTAVVFATCLKYLGLPANDATIKLHKEDTSTTHDCPGNLIHKADFIKNVGRYM